MMHEDVKADWKELIKRLTDKEINEVFWLIIASMEKRGLNVT